MADKANARFISAENSQPLLDRFFIAIAFKLPVIAFRGSESFAPNLNRFHLHSSPARTVRRR